MQRLGNAFGAAIFDFKRDVTVFVHDHVSRIEVYYSAADD